MREEQQGEQHQRDPLQNHPPAHQFIGVAAVVLPAAYHGDDTEQKDSERGQREDDDESGQGCLHTDNLGRGVDLDKWGLDKWGPDKRRPDTRRNNRASW